jgi:hypothetical protein
MIAEAIGVWLLGKSAEAALEGGAKAVAARLTDKTARAELATIGAEAIEAACSAASSLAADLRSPPFLEGVILPTIVGFVEEPTSIASADTMVSRYIDMFVARFADAESEDAALARIFQSDRAELSRAFEAFFARFKTLLYASDHWKGTQHIRTTEQIFHELSHIRQRLDDSLADRRAAAVDLPAATADAAKASRELAAWPTEIDGIRLESPVLGLLLTHIAANPAGTSLLIGEAGAGKSALFARLTEELNDRKVTTYAIKADLLPATIETLDDLAIALGVPSGLEDRIAALAGNHPVVLLIDQLDAVSDVMDRKSARMQLLLRLVHEIGEKARDRATPLAIHVLVSSRPFEAGHDARFQRLGAEKFHLGLLDDAQVDEMLEHLGLKRRALGPKLLESLRRPFALKLFVDIVKSGEDVAALASGNLLDRWLDRADLGDEEERRECIALLTALAAEMIETETLWRPADAFELDYKRAVRRCRAAGLLAMSDKSLGFSHQSWLDDFQAKSHRTAASLTAYTWTHQDSLFVRGTILRALERQRVQDPGVYAAAIAKLLGDPKTRRHVKHLIADIVAANPMPSAAEAGWVEHWVQTDRPLAQRALGKLVERWPAWRGFLRPLLAVLMKDARYQWQATRLLAAEVRIDAVHVAQLIERHWGTEEQDRAVFNILQEAGYVGPEVAGRLQTILRRTTIDEHFLASLITRLRTDERFEEAARIVGLWVKTVPMTRDYRASLYQLEKLGAAAPLETAAVLLPWFIEFASLKVDPPDRISDHYPESRSLPWGWSREHENERGGPFEALLVAIRRLGEERPDALWELVGPLTGIENDDVHEVIAIGLIAAGPALANESLAYLLGDTRRFLISRVSVDGGDGIMRSIMGWHSNALVAAIAPGLSAPELKMLMTAIESWSRYPASFLADMSAADKRYWLHHAKEARYPLLEGLPGTVLGSRRRRIIAEWRAEQPALVGDPNKVSRMKTVGSAMSAAQMERARDTDILRILNEVHDKTGDDWTTRPIQRSGGVGQLAQDFAAFGASQPARAIVFARTHFEAGVHERAAGSLVSELGRSAENLHPELLKLILDLNAKGFASSHWRQSAGHALQQIAGSQNGLSDEMITLLESWLVTDSETVAARMAARAEEKEDDFKAEAARPLLFHSTGGMETVPSGNFTFLAAIATGCLCREPIGADALREALERHLARDEEPAVWTEILLMWGRWLTRGDTLKLQSFFAALWSKYPVVFLDHRMVHLLWMLREEISADIHSAILIHWLVGDKLLNRQAAAEIITGGHIVEPDSVRFTALFELLNDTDVPTLAGKLFSAASAWRENDPTLRAPAHAILMPHLAAATGPVAHAISTAVDRDRTLVPDDLTRDMLEALMHYETVLEACLNTQFIDGLQGLLYHPGYDPLIFAVTDRIADLIIKRGQGIGSGLAGRELVHVAIALQRSEGPLRPQAMDLYEKLLDAQIYGAEEAANASLGR